LLHVDHGAGVNKRIVRQSFTSAKCDALVRIEAPSELVCVVDAENSAIKFNVAANTEVPPLVSLNLAGLRNEVSFEEDALRNPRIGNLWLKNVDCVILKVVVNSALADTIIFIGIFDDRFLEVGREI